MFASQWLSLIIMMLALLGIAFGRLPGLRMNRATIALVGAAALVFSGTISLQQAYDAIDLNTITLLLSMMIFNANLHLAGFFAIITQKIVRWTKNQRQFLVLIIFSSGILSALFLNDTIVLIFTPLILDVTVRLRINPLPYLMGLVTAANIGSTATIIGNPQNMLIGISSGISFTEFTLYLLPVALAGLVVSYLIIMAIYRREIGSIPFIGQQELHVRPYKPLLYKSTVTALLMLAAFIGGVSIPLAALGGASLLLVTRRLKPARVFREIDWSLLVFFSGLFIITSSVEQTGIARYLFQQSQPYLQNNVGIFTLLTAVVSNLISNVPAVLLLKPLVSHFTDIKIAWLILAMATTFAGNLTLIGSVANLIVAETAKNRGIILSFTEYLKAGIPITVITLVIGILWFTWLM